MIRFTRENTKLTNNGDGTYELECVKGIDRGDTLGSVMPAGLARRYVLDFKGRDGWAWQHPDGSGYRQARTRAEAVDALCDAWNREEMWVPAMDARLRAKAAESDARDAAWAAETGSQV